jgi:hypothetical protein
MKKLKLKTVTLICLIALANSDTPGQTIPEADLRLTEIRHLDLTYNFTGYRTREEWQTRAD